jgi:outer membrane protein assembly factor BamA
MTSLGGDNTLRGYNDYRFHDNDMQSFNLESRWALLAHVDAVAFVDAGKVAPRAGDLDFTHLRTSYGVGLRVHNSASTLGRMDIGHGVEGWQIFFQISDPFNRSTSATGRRAVVPFVP